MLIYCIFVIFSKFMPCLCEKIVFGFMIDPKTIPGIYLLGKVSDKNFDLNSCVNACKRTDACIFINFYRQGFECSLIGQKVNLVNIDVTLTRLPGYVYGNKTDWNISPGLGDQVRACGPPPVVYSANRRGNMFTYNSKIKFVCTNDTSKTITATCQAGGTWSGTDLLCITDCESAPDLNNAVKTGSSTSIGSSVTYSCNPPYNKVETITCQQNGTWTELTIQCIPDECTTDPNNRVYGSSCYVYVPAVKVWSDARAYCETLGGYLVIISTVAEMEYLADTFVETIPNYNNADDSRRLYMGLTDVDVQGTFVWSDGTSLTYDRWSSGEPNGGYVEDCVMFASWNGKWFDMSCTRRLGSVCEFDLQ